MGQLFSRVKRQRKVFVLHINHNIKSLIDPRNEHVLFNRLQQHVQRIKIVCQWILGCIDSTWVKVYYRTVLQVSPIRVENPLFENLSPLTALGCDIGVFEPLLMFLYVIKNRQGTEGADRQVTYLKDKRVLIDLVRLLLFQVLLNAIYF